jgi:Arc-like DNA binding dprotein
MARKPTDIVPLQLRLPEALRRQLASEAEKAQRSLNSEILWRLGKTLTPEWREFISESERTQREIADRFEEFKNRPEIKAHMEKFVREFFDYLPPEAFKKQRGTKE